MCGRFTLHSPPQRWVAEFVPLLPIDDFPFQMPPRYNIAPTQNVMCVYREVEAQGLRLAEPMRWGLIPFWADDLAIGNRMINARCETVIEKPAYRAAWKRRRCLIPADGYFEWKTTGKVKQPFLIEPSDGSLMALAGLYEENSKVTPDGSSIRSCTLLTTGANSVTSRIHDRMPVLIDPADFDAWMDPSNEGDSFVQSLMRPAPDKSLVIRPVSKRLGNPRNEGEDLIQPENFNFE
jgi:putative SOS response-associated peptidase YedK